MSKIRLFNINLASEEIKTPVESVLDFCFFKDKLKQLSEEQVPNKDLILSKIAKIESDESFYNQPISLELLKRYEEDLEAIMSPFFSPLLQENEIKACMMPFFPYLFNGTDRFISLLDKAGGPSNVEVDMGSKEDHYLMVCVFILERFYHVNLDTSKVFHVKVKNAESGAYSYYRSLINADFMRVVIKDEKDRLSANDISHLLDNVNDHELWLEKIKPSTYQLKGFGLMTLLDMTRDKTISNLKSDLLQADLLYRKDLQKEVNRSLRSILRIPDLKIGFLAYDADLDALKAVGIGLWNSILMKGKNLVTETDFLRPEFINTKKPEGIKLLNEDLRDKLLPNLLENLEGLRVKSYAAIPLIYEEDLIGIMEISSSVENSITRLKVSELGDITPLFVTAFKGYVDDYETQLKAIIQEKYTAIHPAVEWRFKEAAEDAFSMRSIGQKETDKVIQFEGIQPLYGQTDIKSSSQLRNEAIRKDISIQLEGTQLILDEACQHYNLPVYKMLLQQIKDHKSRLQSDLGAGDETELLKFLSNKIYPTFSHLANSSDKLTQMIKDYQHQLDPFTGLINTHRSIYEKTLAEVNKVIGIALDKGQAKAQSMFPHYFKKYKTDGIEHDMYIGASLSKYKDYDDIYLDNLRLWQMMVICEIENKILDLQRDREYTLDVCSLILVHSSPISIKFRMDEKQFDVEGAYNLRYEIIKKRIDKATIKGTDERITQPGQLAIIYTQDEERDAYLSYIKYLQSINYLEKDVENLALSDMQGVTGLKALRVNIAFANKEEERRMYSDEVLMSFA